MSTPDYLNRFRSGFTLFPMMWTVKNDFDADPFYLDRKAVRWVGTSLESCLKCR